MSRAPHLADHDPIGAHAQRVSYEILNPDSHPPAPAVGRAGLEEDDVHSGQVQLGGVVHGDDPILRG